MRKRSMGSIVAVMAAVATLAVTASAADPSAAQPGPGQGAAPKRSAPAATYSGLRRANCRRFSSLRRSIFAPRTIRKFRRSWIRRSPTCRWCRQTRRRADRFPATGAGRARRQRGRDPEGARRSQFGECEAGRACQAVQSRGRRTAAKKSPRAHSPRRSDAGGRALRPPCLLRRLPGSDRRNQRRTAPLQTKRRHAGQCAAGAASSRLALSFSAMRSSSTVSASRSSSFSSSRRTGDCASGQDSARALAFFTSPS